jgi:hypothetical protein
MTGLILLAVVVAFASIWYVCIIFTEQAVKQKLTQPMHWLLTINTCFVVGLILYFVLMRKSGLGYIFFEILLVLGVIWILTLYPLLIWIAVDFARRTGRSAKRWGWGAALGMYLLVFWDQIPTYLLHHYYCATEAGVWIYKTPEQWKAENPGVAETLTWKNLSDEYRNETHSWYTLNERFHWVSTRDKNPVFPIRIDTDEVVDIKKEEVVLKMISVGSGYPGSGWHLRNMWIGCKPCRPDWKIFSEHEDKSKKIGRLVK